MPVRPRLHWSGGVLLTAGVLLGAPLRGDELVRFPARRLPDGTAVPAHRVFPTASSDAAAATRREELLRAPYLGAARELEARGGTILLRVDASLPEALAPALAAGLDRAAAQLFDRDGFAPPFSRGGRLRVLVSTGRDGVSAAGWARREKAAGALVDPVVSVTGGERGSEAVLLDAVHALAALSLRRTAPSAPSWAVEGFAEALARRALGWRGEPLHDESDPLRADSGDAREPVVLAALFERLLDKLPGGASDARAAWEEARGGGADVEALLRDLGAKADPRGLPAVLTELVAGRLELGATGTGARRTSPDLAVAAPGPLSWKRVTLATAGDRGGLELGLPEQAQGLARAVVFYRGDDGGFDAAPLEPGAPRRFPLAGTTELDLLLVDGDGRDLAIRARRLPDYPAALAAAAAEREGSSVRVSWRTSAHRDLLAWVVVRLDEGDDGAWREGSRELVPTTSAATSGYEYVILDRTPSERRSLYRVFALTTEGFLSETFEATVSAVE